MRMRIVLFVEVLDGESAKHEAMSSWDKEYVNGGVVENDAFIRASRSHAEAMARAVIRTLHKRSGKEE